MTPDENIMTLMLAEIVDIWNATNPDLDDPLSEADVLDELNEWVNLHRSELEHLGISPRADA